MLETGGNMKRWLLLLLSGATLAVSVIASSSAFATPVDTVTIGLQNSGANSGVLTSVATGPGFASFNGSYGTFFANSVVAFGASFNSPPDLLQSNAIDIKCAPTGPCAGGSLNIYVTDQGITDITGLATFISSLTENALTNGWSVTEATYLDPLNGLFTTTIPLGSETFTGIGTDVDTTLANTGGGPYSITQVYTITAIGRGTANSTIDVSAEVPEPASMTLLGSGLLALAAVMRRRRRKAI